MSQAKTSPVDMAAKHIQPSSGEVIDAAVEALAHCLPGSHSDVNLFL